jgi:sugar O-acyltransferase (sialic acid O-acetyltransferase NeuD family)
MLTVLGSSEATLTMITDNLESSNWFTKIKIINNLQRNTTLQYINEKFEYSEEYELKTKVGSFIIGAVNTVNKIAIYDFFSVPDDQFINVIHRSSQLSSTAILAKGIIINSLVSIAAHTNIGYHVSINRNSSVGHHVKIEKFVTIGPGCSIGGNVRIGAGTTIGMGTNIRDGITIGSNCVIGMGSTVIGNVPSNTKVFGLVK